MRHRSPHIQSPRDRTTRARVRPGCPGVHPASDETVGKEHSYKLAILMTSEVPGTLQVYYDTGAGLREADSVAVPLETERREYELPLPQGGYRLLRIDPGNQGGRYTIERAAIRSPDGSIYRAIPLGELRPVHQLSLVERTSERLVVDSPPGSNDPQLLYAPSLPFQLSSRPPSVGLLLARLLGYVFALVLLIGAPRAGLAASGAHYLAVAAGGSSMVRGSPEGRNPGRGGDRYADCDVSHSVPEPKLGLAKQRRDRDVVRPSALRARIAGCLH